MATVVWDIHAVTAMLQQIGTGSATLQELKQASAMAGFLVERHAKLNITRMVYSQPQRGYRRTGTLRRSIHTASPGASHDSDEAKARTSELGGNQSPSVVRVTGDKLTTEVGTWLKYAKRVHDGTGPRMTAKPYLTDALDHNRREIEDIIAQGLVKALTRVVR